MSFSESPEVVRSRPVSGGVEVDLRNKALHTKYTRKVKDKKTQRIEMPDHKHIAPDGSC